MLPGYKTRNDINAPLSFFYRWWVPLSQKQDKKYLWSLNFIVYPSFFINECVYIYMSSRYFGYTLGYCSWKQLITMNLRFNIVNDLKLGGNIRIESVCCCWSFDKCCLLKQCDRIITKGNHWSVNLDEGMISLSCSASSYKPSHKIHG